MYAPDADATTADIISELDLPSARFAQEFRGNSQEKSVSGQTDKGVAELCRQAMANDKYARCFTE